MKLLAPMLIVALSGLAAAQCELRRLDPDAPITTLDCTGTISDGVVAVAGFDRHVAVFEQATGDWDQIGNFQSEGKAWLMPFLVANQGGTVVTGVPESGNATGRVFVYENGQGWTQPTVLEPNVPEAWDTFGAAIAIHGDTLAIGAPMIVVDVICGPGKTFIFERAGAQWIQTGKFHPHGFTLTMQNFGVEVDTDGSTVVAGASLDDELGVFSGAVYVYECDESGWHEEAKLFPSNPADEPNMGSSVAVDGDIIMAGTVSGSVHVYRRLGAGWVETQILRPSDSQPDDHFGASLSLDGNRAVIGAPYVDSMNTDTGAFYIYHRESAGWVLQDKVVPDGVATGARFGNNVHLDGNVVLWMGIGQAKARLHSLEGGGIPYCASSPNSTGRPARLNTDDCASLSGGVTFRALSIPDATGLFFYGPAAIELPFGNGYLCVGGPLTRSPLFTTSGTATWTPDFSRPPHDQITAGSTWKFQAVFRDPTAGGSGFDLTNGLSMTFFP